MKTATISGESMAGISKLVDETLELRAIEELKALGKIGEVANKLRAVIASKSNNITYVAKIFMVTRMTLNLWIKSFKKDGALGLVDKPKKPRGSRLNPDQLSVVEGWLKENCSLTINALRIKIIDHFGIELSMATAHRIIKKLDFSYITPRPKHYKQNLNSQNEFKKKSAKDI